MCGLLTNGKLRQANLKMLFERAKQYEKASFKGLYNFINFIDKLKTNSGDLSAAKVIGENDNVIRIMSIHKSKGLEFPVVFLSLTGKKFNFRDLNESILLHQELGLGIKYKDNEKQIEYPTLTKEAIKIKSKKEVISEAVAITQPPSDKGRRLKVYYAAQVSVRPPTFVIFVNSKPLMHFSYVRYLENHIRKHFEFKGTPIHMIIREKGKREK